MRKKLMTGDEVQQTIRIPKHIYDWVQERANQERRSFNSQVALDLEKLMNLEKQDSKAAA